MGNYAHAATVAQVREAAITRAPNALAIASDSPTRHRVIVQLVAELASAGVWSEAEETSRRRHSSGHSPTEKGDPR